MKRFLLLKGIFETEINHSESDIIRRGTISYEYFCYDKWFNFHKFYNPDGSFKNFYCNLNLPPSLDLNISSYIDLKIDGLVNNSFEVEILDLDEFESNSEKYSCPETLVVKTFNSLDKLLLPIRNRNFPFNKP